MRANGLRDLIETFSIFLDRLYEPFFVLNKGFDGNGKRLSPPKVYERRGITDKLDTLSRILEISETDRKVLVSLNQARNCFAHRRGVVGEPDVDPKVGHMTLVWTAFQFEIEEPDGNVVV